MKESKKKTSKKEKNIEKEIEKLEKVENVLDKIEKEEKASKKLEEKRKSEIKNKLEDIREDLKAQLLNQNKFGKQFEDMIEDYLFLLKLKEELKYDIKENGIRYSSMTGNGYMVEKPNESVQNILKVNGQMLKILQDLELKAPDEEGEGDDLL